MASSGSSENSPATQAPSTSPEAIDAGAGAKTTSTGSMSRTSRGSSHCSATPTAAPSALPASPRPTACRRYAAKIWPAVAPRQRSTAIVSIFFFMSARTALATPRPPRSSATRPISDR